MIPSETMALLKGGGGFFLRKRAQGCIFSRSVFVASKSRTKTKRRPVEDKVHKWAVDDTARVQEYREEDYQRKLKEIRRLTSSVSRLIQRKEDEKKQVELVADIPMPSEIDLQKEADSLYKSIEQRPVDVLGTSLLTPVVDLPPAIQDRLGLSVKYLVNQDNQNWPLVLQTLRQAGGFEGLKKSDIGQLVNSIPKKDLEPIIPHIKKLMKEAKIPYTAYILTRFIQALSSSLHVSPDNLKAIERTKKTIARITKGTVPLITYETMVNAYGKMGNVDKINELLVEMKTAGVKPTPFIYSAVLKTLVYTAQNHKEAVTIFDSMKFLSQQTKPGTEAYKDVIVSYVNANNIEKALDLYQEMVSSKTPVNQPIMVALAKGCSSRKELRFKAWEFMFEIYDNKWTPSVESMEYMIYLASKDGDLALARAFYRMLAKTDSVSKRSLTFLLMAYSKSNTFKSPPELPSITLTEKGRNFRSNVLNQPHPPLSQDMKLNVPFLPVLDLNSAEEVIAEAKALWNHTMMFNPGFVNIDSYNTYLNIAATLGSKKDLKSFYGFSKLVDDAPGVRVIEENIIDEDSVPEDSTVEDSIENRVLQDIQKFHVERSTLTYVIALKGAGRLKLYDFSQEIWSERGKYRQSATYKSLHIREKDTLDFQFANQMVQSLTNMGLLEDAVAIVLSTEYQFKWSWLHLRRLFDACVEVGNEKHTRTLRAIAGRAQIKFEGKIRRKDFKEYVMRKKLNA